MYEHPLAKEGKRRTKDPTAITPRVTSTIISILPLGVFIKALK